MGSKCATHESSASSESPRSLSELRISDILFHDNPQAVYSPEIIETALH